MARGAKPRHFIRSGRKGGTKGMPSVEIPVDGLPKPVPVDEAAKPGPALVRIKGRFADSETAKFYARKGGRAKAHRVRLEDATGIAQIAETSAFRPYRRGADEFIPHHSAELARVAGGTIGSGPSSMIASAALQLAGSRYCFDQFAKTNEAHWLKLGSSLANDSRQNLLAAYSHAVLEAQARDQSTGDAHLYEDDGKGAKS